MLDYMNVIGKKKLYEILDSYNFKDDVKYFQNKYEIERTPDYFRNIVKNFIDGKKEVFHEHINYKNIVDLMQSEYDLYQL
jgi:hypothetical protein